MSSWTLSEVLEIVHPLLGRLAKNGTSKLRNVRLRFLQRKLRKGLPRDIQEGWKLCEFAIELNRYHAMGRKDFSRPRPADSPQVFITKPYSYD
jgi:hypothetical protein